MDQAASVRDTSPVLELRQYTLHPGRREELIALFESRLIEPQEACGMRVLGQFRDLDHPDRFVWLRGFASLLARAPALQEFYGGPVWKANREAANATMIDSDDVLLLRPIEPLSLPAGPRALVVATIYLLAAPVDGAFRRFFEARMVPLLAESGAPPIGRYETEPARNEFPRLPVREGEHAFAWFASFADAADHASHVARLRSLGGWSEVEGELARRLASAPQVLRLGPTARSRLGGAPAGDVHDFDFIAGEWTVVNRRLKARGVGSHDWDEFPATHRGALYLDGIANVDEMRFTTQGWSGMTVRAFDRAARRWSIWWIDGKTGRMFPPVMGGFHGDRGEFYGDDTDGGRPVKVRYVWLRLGPDAARWEQAFSFDGGANWETNWTMDFARVSR